MEYLKDMQITQKKTNVRNEFLLNAEHFDIECMGFQLQFNSDINYPKCRTYRLKAQSHKLPSL